MSKEEESLEKCEVAEFKNVTHPSCCKKLMTTFGEDEWEGPLFCGKCCLKHQNKALNAAASRPKEEYHGIMILQLQKSIPWQF